MNLAIIGCGLVGRKRAATLGRHNLIACADVRRELAAQLAAEHEGCEPEIEPVKLLSRTDVDAVLVCTTHDSLAPLTMAALEAGKHVLVEKPAARTLDELQPVREAAARGGRVVKVGFNHRFHPGLRKAHELFADGAISELMYIRARYGHGGRLGYEQEWRASKDRAGGGELLDQGSHLIDLARWFAGDFSGVAGHVATCFWPMPVEDNAFLSLRTATGVTAWLHASWTEWKNLFSFEVFGRTGKLQVDGLGGSYGPERLTYYRMLPEMGPPETTTYEFPPEDRSWAAELEDFVAAIEQRREPCGTLDDAAAVLDIAAKLYEAKR
ncbi:MAG TPA: Gfo/Idh/MocA family oxidoreductase [Chloroflexota bacterium]|nr:Gfo/Idh/MocA family oxidoreductase [Chloroflexota bacterium]